MNGSQTTDAHRTTDPVSRPILFSGPMVRALLDGRKTQTRRALKHQPIDILPMPNAPGREWVILEQKAPEPKGKVVRCRFGKPGDLLWVRETWGVVDDKYHRIAYRADDGTASARVSEQLEGRRWRPSIHMPRSASRITLRITEVRVERLNDISPEDAAAEGWPGPDEQNTIASAYPIAWYARLWDQINGPRSYDANPWVWVVKFERAADRMRVAA